MLERKESKMKKVTKIIAFLVSAIMLIGFAAGCTTEKKDDKVFEIGVIQFVQHPALDAAYNGFVEALAEAGYVDGENINIEFQNASGEQANCQTIAANYVNAKKDLILAIATPAAAAAAMQTTEIPILITAVTDPVDAGLVESIEVPNTNVSGTSDLTPVSDQINLITKLLPEAESIAILYTSSEVNSVIQANLAKAAAADLGLDAFDATVSNSNEIQQVIQSLAGKVDAIYAPTDNLIANGMPTVSMVATEIGIPIICGEEGMVEQGGLIAYGINYHDLGRITGEQAARVLGGEDISKMSVEYLPEDLLSTTINQAVVDALGIEIPADILDNAEIITE